MSKTIVYTVSTEETRFIPSSTDNIELIRFTTSCRKVFTDFDDAVEYVEQMADASSLRTSDNHRLSDRIPYDMGWKPFVCDDTGINAVATLFPTDNSPLHDDLLCVMYHISAAELV